MTFIEVFEQTNRYNTAMAKLLRSSGKTGQLHEVIVVLGKEILDWDDAVARERGISQLREQNTRVMLYDELLVRARAQYEEYIRASEKSGKLVQLLSKIGDPLREELYETQKQNA